jgi:hypothetical protein
VVSDHRDDEPRPERPPIRAVDGSQSAALGWPIATLGLGLLASITVITVMGGDVDALNNVLGKLLAAVGAAGGLGAWVNSTRAAKQTNGVMDERIAAGVERGILLALERAQAQAAAVRPARGRAQPPAA